MENVIVLASGGLDSYVLTHWLKKQSKKITIFFIDYNQKPLKPELGAVRKLARETNSKLEIIKLKWLGKISTSLINKKNKAKTKDEIINWYVPFRNSIFINLALALAESIYIKTKKKNDIYLGIKYEGLKSQRFKDTTPEFLRQMNKLADFSEQTKFKILAPFLNKDKEEIVELGNKMNLKLENSFSCYIGNLNSHCGVCAGCLARKKAFKFSKSQIKDTTRYIK